MAKEKNVDLLLSAQQKINEKDKNVKLIMVGDGLAISKVK